MKLVLDTNILFAALLRNSNTRSILLHPAFNFYLHEYAFTELAKYKQLIVSKTGISPEDYELMLNMLLENITIVPAAECELYFAKAKEIMQNIDPFDAPFIALALSFNNDGIWTQDKRFDKQNVIKIWKTVDILDLISNGKIR